jgi:monoamine oxidase
LLNSFATPRRQQLNPTSNATSDNSAISRREFVRTISAATAGLALPASLFGARQIATSARVAVVGAGLAGLTCAYRLKRRGIIATVYEANTRLGGRCWTNRDDFAHGHNAEHGGELIDQGHTTIRHLAQELGLGLDNLLAAEPNGSTILLHFDGVAYSYRDAVRDLKRIWQPLHRDLIEAGFPTLYNNYTARGAQLDQMSVSDWIDQTVPGGLDSPLGQLLQVAYTIEYGAECDVQSALISFICSATTAPASSSCSVIPTRSIMLEAETIRLSVGSPAC